MTFGKSKFINETEKNCNLTSTWHTVALGGANYATITLPNNIKHVRQGHFQWKKNVLIRHLSPGGFPSRSFNELPV